MQLNLTLGTKKHSYKDKALSDQNLLSRESPDKKSSKLDLKKDQKNSDGKRGRDKLLIANGGTVVGSNPNMPSSILAYS